MATTTPDGHARTAPPRDEAAEKTGVDVVGEEARPFDPHLARRVLWKIDLFLMPAMLIGAWFLDVDARATGSSGLTDLVERIWAGLL